MSKLFYGAAGAALLALVGCTHEGPDANAPPPASDTMQSQTNDMGQPFPSSPRVHESSPVPNNDVNCPNNDAVNGVPGARPCGHEDASPAPNDNPMPKKPVPIAPYSP